MILKQAEQQEWGEVGKEPGLEQILFIFYCSFQDNLHLLNSNKKILTQIVPQNPEESVIFASETLFSNFANRIPVFRAMNCLHHFVRTKRMARLTLAATTSPSTPPLLTFSLPRPFESCENKLNFQTNKLSEECLIL